MYSQTSFVTETMYEEFHTNCFSIMGLGTLALILIENFSEVFTCFHPPLRMVFVIVRDDFGFSISIEITS